jgi:hypothetical protein
VRRSILAIAALVLVVPLVIMSAPELVHATRLAFSLRGKPWVGRREIVFADYYAAVVAFSKFVPEGSMVALVPKRPADRDVAMFSIYHFYPRAARVYWTVDEWRASQPRPPWVVIVDQSTRPMMTLLHDDGGTLREVTKR